MGIRKKFIKLLLIGTLLLSGCDLPNGQTGSLTFDVACSSGELVAAIRKSNEFSPNETITLNLEPNCEYIFDDSSAGDDGMSALPTIFSSIIIEGNQSTLKLIKRSDDPSLRMIHIGDTGSLTLSQITLTTEDPSTLPYIYREIYEKGGSIINEGNLLLDTVTFMNNFGFWGGAIYNDGELTITNSIFEFNKAQGSGGAIYSKGDIQINGTSYITNEAVSGYGGAIYQEDSALSIAASVFSANENIEGDGGGAVAQIGGSLTIAGSIFDSNRHHHRGSVVGQGIAENIGGGAIFLMGVDFKVSNSQFSNNSTNEQGGAISLSDEAWVYENIAGWDDPKYELTEAGININPNAGALIEGCAFLSNQAETASGAIHNQKGQLTLKSSTFSDNLSDSGEGLMYHGGEDLIIDHCSITNNTSVDGDSLIYATGGGSVSCESCLIAYNDSEFGSLVTNWGNDASINNSTFSQNSGPVFSWGTMMIHSSTIVQNSSIGIVYDPAWGSPVMTIENSIIANNTGGDCDFRSGITAIGANLDTDGSCSGFSITADPLIEPLSDNGGQTMTHALQISSPAIGAAAGVCLPTDQRDVSRVGNGCDLGAYEDSTISDESIYPSITTTPDTFDRCALFNQQIMTLSILGIPIGTTEQTIYITIPDGVPGLEYDIHEDQNSWEYTATLGGVDADFCKYDDIPGRLYCSFILPESAIGTTLELFVYVNECPTSIYYHPGVSIIPQVPPTQEPPTLICTVDLGEADCIAAGGEYKDSPGMITPYCECP